MTISLELVVERQKNLIEKVELMHEDIKLHTEELHQIALWRAKIIGVLTVVSPVITLALHFIIKWLDGH